MQIIGRITGIKYKPYLCRDLKTIASNQFDINSAPTTCLLLDNQNTFAISKWVSPKGSVRSSDSPNCVDNFLIENNFSENQKRFINTLFQEAIANNFIVTIAHSQ